MAPALQEAQISVRVPRLVHTRLEKLRDEVVEATGEKKPSQPEVVAALICTAKAAALSQALKQVQARLGCAGSRERRPSGIETYQAWALCHSIAGARSRAADLVAEDWLS